MGHEVIILDDFSTGREQNLVNIQGHSRLQVHNLDVCNEKAIEPYFLGVDWVFHLAALADIVPSIQHPLTYLRVDVGGTQAVLEASRLANVKRFVYAASSSCYGRGYWPYARSTLPSRSGSLGGGHCQITWQRTRSSDKWQRDYFGDQVPQPQVGVVIHA